MISKATKVGVGVSKEYSKNVVVEYPNLIPQGLVIRIIHVLAPLT